MKRQSIEYWAKRITEQQEKGISAKEYCRQRSISRSTFLRWRRKIKCEERDQDLIEITRAMQGPLRRPPITMSIRIGNGIRIDFHNKPDPDTLGRIIASIRTASAT